MMVFLNDYDKNIKAEITLLLANMTLNLFYGLKEEKPYKN